MALPAKLHCLRCSRSKVDEPDMFYSRKYRDGTRMDSCCIPCKKEYQHNRYASETRTCSVSGCEQKLSVNGLCSMHRHRKDRLGGVGEAGRRKAPSGTGSVDKNGYRRIKGKGPEHSVMEHRHVMADILGRPLFRHETPHHKNGVRHDNRPENLELWSSWQPPGQRVEDKVAWAKELLELYLPVDELVTWIAGIPDTDVAQPPSAA